MTLTKIDSKSKLTSILKFDGFLFKKYIKNQCSTKLVALAVTVAGQLPLPWPYVSA